MTAVSVCACAYVRLTAVRTTTALVEKVRRDRTEVLQSHEELVKRLKAELAHWKASAEDSKNSLTDAKQALAMYAQLTNVSMAEEGDGYRCVATNRDGQRAMTFHLTSLEDGTVDYRCEEVSDPLAPSFFREDINFDKGQASVFFREVTRAIGSECVRCVDMYHVQVLKVLTREPIVKQ